MWGAIKAFWELLKSKAKEWAYLVLIKLKDSLTLEILNIAKEAVHEVEQLALNGDIGKEEKWAEAYARIRDYAGQRGLFVKDSVINFAIELAVQYWDELGWPP